MVLIDSAQDGTLHDVNMSKEVAGFDLPDEVSGNTDANYASDESVSHASDDTTDTLERTVSQVEKQAHIQGIVQRLDERREPIQEFRRTVSELAGAVGERSCVESLQEASDLVEGARKRARNFGEDLLDDMLALDALSGLAQPDRLKRKAAVASIEALLEDVDHAKARLGNLNRDLAASLEDVKNNVGEEEQQEASDNIRVQASDCPQSNAQVASVKHQPPSTSPSLPVQLSPPMPALWRSMTLPIKFRSREDKAGYEINACAPGLVTDAVEIDVDTHQWVLRVAGLCLPQPHEELQMQKVLAARLRRAVRQNESIGKNIAPESMERAALDAYMDMGQGSYGRFHKTFEIPQDVDLRGINYSYHEGMLRIALPKRALPRQHSQQLPIGFNRYHTLNGLW